MTGQSNNEVVEFLAIGLGPANLSLAALATSYSDLSIEFIEKKPKFEWHEGALLDDSSLQSSFLRDLVTLVDPTHKYSFLSYLHQNKRIYQFMSADFTHAPRAEFSRYYQWVASQLDNVSYNEWVNEIHFNNELYSVHTSKRIIRAKHLILGTGTIPHYPEHSILDINENVFHGMSYKSKEKAMFKGKNVVIVGNNQTAAEVFLDLFQQDTNSAETLNWVAEDILRNSNVQSPLHTELFTPAYNEFYQTLNDQQSEKLSTQQSALRDGVCPKTIKEIYQKLYQRQFESNENAIAKVLINNTVKSQQENGEQIDLTIVNQITSEIAILSADIVIYCTGLEHKLPEFLNPIKSLFSTSENGIITDSNHCAKTTITSDNRLYVQNGSAATFGITNQHLALGAWNGATIINHLLGYDAYDLSPDDTIGQWQFSM